MSALAPARTRASAVAPARSRAGTPQARSTPARPRLRLVVTAPVAARVPFAVLVGVILTGGLVALLMLHTLAAQDAFTLHSLQRQAAALDDTEQELAVADQQAAAPSALAAHAKALGMVPTGALKITRRPNGQVVAVARAVPPPAPAPSPTPSATSSAAAKAASGKPAAKQSSAPASHDKGTTTARHRTTRPTPAGGH